MNFNVTDKINHFNGAIRTDEIFIAFFKPYHKAFSFAESTWYLRPEDNSKHVFNPLIYNITKWSDTLKI